MPASQVHPGNTVNFNRRKSSIKTFISSHLGEKEKLCKQQTFRDGALQTRDTDVPSGCLSQETGELVLAVALGEQPSNTSINKGLLGLASLVVVPPLIAGLVNSIPLGDPSLGVNGSGVQLFAIPGVVPVFWGFGSAYGYNVLRNTRCSLSYS
jgi:hypothetical protein